MLGSWVARFLPGTTDLRDLAVAIVGAGHEPGRSVALAFASAGSRVALIEDRPGQLKALVEEARNSGGGAIANASIAEAAAVLRGLDAVVFTTGQTQATSLRSLEAARFESVLREQTVAALGLIQDAVDVLESRGRGTILAITVGAGWARGSGPGPQAAATAATLQTIEALRSELADSGIHMATVVPSGLAGWHPSNEQIASAATLVVSARLRGLALPPGAQALEALGALAPAPIASLIDWFAAPPPNVTPSRQPSSQSSPREVGEENRSIEPAQEDRRENRDAVRAAAERAARLARALTGDDDL
jgi:3-oxoacyl-[acyl-carrier protein] reductase